MLYLLIVISVFLIMEFNSWFLHKFVMHGFLWNLHYDHHNKHPGFFEKNDAFFLFFAIPSWLLIMFGSIYESGILVSIGFGILFYGIAYFLVHEVLIHNRFKKIRKFLFARINNDYLHTLIYAHKMHHKHINKDEGESYGMLIVNKQYFIEYKERKNRSNKN